MTRKWIEVNDLSVYKNVRFQNVILRSDLYDYSDVYIAVKEKITAKGDNNTNNNNKNLQK